MSKYIYYIVKYKLYFCSNVKSIDKFKDINYLILNKHTLQRIFTYSLVNTLSAFCSQEHFAECLSLPGTFRWVSITPRNNSLSAYRSQEHFTECLSLPGTFRRVLIAPRNISLSAYRSQEHFSECLSLPGTFCWVHIAPWNISPRAYLSQ